MSLYLGPQPHKGGALVGEELQVDQVRREGLPDCPSESDSLLASDRWSRIPVRRVGLRGKLCEKQRCPYDS